MICSALQWFFYGLEAMAIMYMILIGLYTYGLFRLGRAKPSTAEPSINVSVVVAARNEERHLEGLLESLSQQSYPKHLFEIIIIDDHSDDNTTGVIQKHIDSDVFTKLKLMLNDANGKKAALRKGLFAAQGELILVTDADCQVPEQWIMTMASAYLQNKPKLILGPVCIKKQSNIFAQMLELEFASLIGSAAGAAGAGVPVMGNAANIGFNRHVAIELDAFAPSETASGDDMFLMMAIRKKHGNGAIKFVYHPEALVETLPQPDISSFIQQRKRWVAKSRSYTDPWIVVPSLVVFIFNLMILLVFAGGFYYPVFFMIFGLFILLKLMIDYPLLYIITGFINRRSLLKWTFLAELVYPFYVCITALLAYSSAYRWKGRSHKQ